MIIISFDLKLVLLLIGFCSIYIASGLMNSQVAGQNKLLEFMVRSRNVSKEYPERSVDCFGYYIPILHEITAEYQRSYAVCLQNSSYARCSVDSSTQNDRDSLESTAKDACQLLFGCNELKNSVDYFQCYVNGGYQNSKTMYSLSINASDLLLDVREKYRLIENEEYRCTNASERAYVEQTSKTYDDLHNCLLGLSALPTNTSLENLSQSANQVENCNIIATQKHDITTVKKKFKRLD